MLLLSRRVGEKITITASNGEVVEITIAEIIPGTVEKPKVRLGFVAPTQVKIVRNEILSREYVEGSNQYGRMKPFRSRESQKLD